MEDKVFEQTDTVQELTAEESGSYVLASKTDRFLAVLIDCAVGMVYAIPFWMYSGMWEVMKSHQQPSLSLTLTSMFFGFITFLIFHGYFLKQHGQTIGKKAIGIRIADMNGHKPCFKTLIFKRYLPMSVLPAIPVVGTIYSLVDVGMIFRKNRRCLHDVIAGTQVLKV